LQHLYGRLAHIIELNNLRQDTVRQVVGNACLFASHERRHDRVEALYTICGLSVQGLRPQNGGCVPKCCSLQVCCGTRLSHAAQAAERRNNGGGTRRQGSWLRSSNSTSNLPRPKPLLERPRKNRTAHYYYVYYTGSKLLRTTSRTDLLLPLKHHECCIVHEDP
jgi:hypothetical protein